ncbi:succinate-semialdehyde dehydrogenase [Candidatus Uhrbacteria bacterium CG10_big_fil_rev_8_21_14_0_10_48_11]|uniref:Succinate-semialdehyde dehydrogenase n=1 Tax=Candidatus Uhrbacteria bacterium CG10_big_fil_rev_8_21_14_0_10_48_11 TaxID=1975037 RepID=A0A2M8LE36_9BACT|nr:MAG: succinate-semialdehyde dehydrogenase [Candidatus Uhrbacteria bacterium CG10_big_fil_rev_8_21_14_0_10_48_11]
MAIESKNPTTLEVVKTFGELTDEALEAALAKADTAFQQWRQTSFEERRQRMLALADYLVSHKAELATLMAVEMGKVLSAGEGEVEKCALVCRYYAEHAEKFLAPESLSVEASESYVAFEPIGPVLAVMPWNFPFWQVYRFAAPAIMAGNVGLLKHASNVPQCAEAIAEAFRASGFPDGVFQNLLIPARRVEGVIRDRRVAAVTLTGSEKAGSDVARIAGEEIKKTVLELGGSDPFIVLDDADIALAAATAAVARLQGNVGQSCIAAKRFIVVEAVAESFTQKLVHAFEQLVVGDPQDAAVHVGPLASEQILRDVERQVSESVAKGAKIVMGATRREGAGHFFVPGVVTNVKKGMPLFDEEVFGPVAPIIVVKDEAEAIIAANDTPYGLGASLFTQNVERAKRLVPQIAAGSVFVNCQVKSDPRAPFGGIKKSGYGRELSAFGIREFVNVKNVRIK